MNHSSRVYAWVGLFQPTPVPTTITIPPLSSSELIIWFSPVVSFSNRASVWVRSLRNCSAPPLQFHRSSFTILFFLFLGCLNLPGLVRDLFRQESDPSTASLSTTKRMRPFTTAYGFGWTRLPPLPIHHYHPLLSTDQAQTAHIPRRASNWVGSTFPLSDPIRHYSFTDDTVGEVRRHGPYRNTMGSLFAPKPSSGLIRPTRSPSSR